MKKNRVDMAALQKVFTYIIMGVFVDQITKMLAVNNLQERIIPLIPNFLRFELTYNTGMAFGLLKNARFLFLIFTVIILVFGWKYYQQYFTKSKWFYWGGILFFAGTLGNFFDRLFYGKVTDFIAVNFGSYQFPIFNVADMLLNISLFVILIAVYLDEKSLGMEQTNGTK